MSPELEPWPRTRFFPGGDEAWLLFHVFGEFAAETKVDSARHRTRGLPEGANVLRLTGEELDQVRRDWVEKEHVGAPAELRTALVAAPSAVHVRVRRPDPRDLDYVRDTIGVVQALLETGGVGVLAVQNFGWWSPEAWRERVFVRGRAALVPELTVILHSREEKGAGMWVHTRGMRQFGRPDLSVRHVPAASVEAAARMCNAFNNVQVDGMLVSEGQEIRSKGLPPGMSAHHAGSIDDPEFNNTHIEVRWPE